MNRFFPHYENLALITAPLARATGKRNFKWADGLQAAFAETKSVFKKPVRLGIPSPTANSILYTEAPGIGLGACLLHVREDGEEHSVAYFSKALDDAQQRYDSYKLEFYALYKHFAVYLSFLAHFTVRTENQALRFWRTSKFAPGVVRAKWKSYPDTFRFDIEHLPGTSNTIAYAISRAPLSIQSTIRMPSQMSAAALTQTAGSSGDEGATWTRHQDVQSAYNGEHRLIIGALRGSAIDETVVRFC